MDKLVLVTTCIWRDKLKDWNEWEFRFDTAFAYNTLTSFIPKYKNKKLSPSFTNKHKSSTRSKMKLYIYIYIRSDLKFTLILWWGLIKKQYFIAPTLVPRIANWPLKLKGMPFLPWIGYIIIEQRLALISMIAPIGMLYLKLTFACLLVCIGIKVIPP